MKGMCVCRHPKIAKSSKQASPYTVTQYCRRGAEEDPWLSVDVHPKNVVYGEGSFNVPGWCGGARKCPASCWQGNALDRANYKCQGSCTHCDDDAVIGHGGANVWVHTVSPPGTSGHRRLADEAPAVVTVSSPVTITTNTTTRLNHTVNVGDGHARRRTQSGGGFGNLGGFELKKATACPLATLHTR